MPACRIQGPFEYSANVESLENLSNENSYLPTKSNETSSSVDINGTSWSKNYDEEKATNSSSIQLSPTKPMTSKSVAHDYLINYDVPSINDEIQLISPSSRWNSQPRSYKGANKDGCILRKLNRKIPSFMDITDGETSGMGSSVDEPMESSTESASEASTSAFQQPKSYRTPTTSPILIKKRRGGCPKGTKRKPELQGIKAPKPKAPVTAYILYLTDRRKYYKETRATLPYVEVFKLVGAEWSALPAEQKALYNARAEQEKKRYKNELQAYRQSPDYLLQLRKKRMKNTRKGTTTTEESSDFTDEIDDDDSEELYCRICDQWFYSYHNKRVHLRGKLHGKAVMGEYQRERKAEELRQESPSELSVIQSISENLAEGCSGDEVKRITVKLSLPSESNFRKNIGDYHSKIFKKDNLKGSPNSLPVIKSNFVFNGENFEIASATEDDHEYDEGERDADEEYDGEEDITEEEGGLDSDRVTDAAGNIIYRVVEREKEIMWLRRRREKALYTHKKLTASLMGLSNRHKKLKEENSKLVEETSLLKKNIYLYSTLANHHIARNLNISSLDSNSTDFLNDRSLEYVENLQIHKERKNYPWRIKCSTGSNESFGVAEKFNLKARLLNCDASCYKEDEDKKNGLFDSAFQELKHSEPLSKVGQEKLKAKPLNLRMRFVKVKSFSSPSKCKSESLTYSKTAVSFPTSPKSSELSPLSISDKFEAVNSFTPIVNSPKSRILSNSTVVTKALQLENGALLAETCAGSGFKPKGMNEYKGSCHSFPHSKVLVPNPILRSPLFSSLDCDKINSVPHGINSCLLGSCDSYMNKNIIPDKSTSEIKNSNNIFSIDDISLPCYDNEPTSFRDFDTVKPPPVTSAISLCFGNKHNTTNSLPMDSHCIYNSPPFRDHENNSICRQSPEILGDLNYSKICESPVTIDGDSPLLGIPVCNSISSVIHDSSGVINYNDDNASPSESLDFGGSQALNLVSNFLSNNNTKNISDFSIYDEYDVSSQRTSVTDDKSQDHDSSINNCGSSSILDDNYLKVLHPPVICEETFFKQFGLDFCNPEHSRTKRVEFDDKDVMLQFPLNELLNNDEITALLDSSN